jgi:hypothetical protein
MKVRAYLCWDTKFGNWIRWQMFDLRNRRRERRWRKALVVIATMASPDLKAPSDNRQLEIAAHRQLSDYIKARGTYG